ncbi:MAG: branched-chain alpha-keto acid dehydrogenase subunit [Candidatus Midichloriaceae bacterium]|nr:branched-chain alpha-keto acid dehydrogenase subunit [Candidatus Midichloriaceae bacterium]
MAIEILMPALSPTMTEGNLAKWLKKEGDKVKSGDVIAEIETDKATMEVESADSGILGKILIAEKSEGIKVNALIGVLLEEGEDKAAIDAIIKKHTNSSAAPEKKAELVEPAQSIKSIEVIHYEAPKSTRIFASPLAKRIARDNGIDITRIPGSGPRGRIVKADVLNFKGVAAPVVGRNPEEYKVLPLTQMRKTIAKRLQESKSTIPHFYLTIECDITELNKAREYLNAKTHLVNGKPEYKISVNDFIIKAIAVALKKVPQANSGWSDAGIMLYNNVDISVAVATEDGLITPIIQNADQKSIPQISSEVKDLAMRAKNNQLKPHEFMGGSFTISNLGMYGVKEFQAIINPPQSCILAISAAEEKPVVRNGLIQIATMMTVSLSCDHRVIDGVGAALLLQEFKAHVEHPVTMFI